MERELIHPPNETVEFIKFLKNLDERQQMGLHLTIEGLGFLAKKRH